MKYNPFATKKPPSEVKHYDTIDSKGNFNTLEWYEGGSFNYSDDGVWLDDNGNEIKDVCFWIEHEAISKDHLDKVDRLHELCYKYIPTVDLEEYMSLIVQI